MYSHCLFLFRRDLRMIDNTGLAAMAAKSKKITVGFIFERDEIEKNHAIFFSSDFYASLYRSLQKR